MTHRPLHPTSATVQMPAILIVLLFSLHLKAVGLPGSCPSLFRAVYATESTASSFFFKGHQIEQLKQHGFHQIGHSNYFLQKSFLVEILENGALRFYSDFEGHFDLPLEAQLELSGFQAIYPCLYQSAEHSDIVIFKTPDESPRIFSVIESRFFTPISEVDAHTFTKDGFLVLRLRTPYTHVVLTETKLREIQITRILKDLAHIPLEFLGIQLPLRQDRSDDQWVGQEMSSEQTLIDDHEFVLRVGLTHEQIGLALLRFAQIGKPDSGQEIEYAGQIYSLQTLPSQRPQKSNLFGDDTGSTTYALTHQTSGKSLSFVKGDIGLILQRGLYPSYLRPSKIVSLLFPHLQREH